MRNQRLLLGGAFLGILVCGAMSLAQDPQVLDKSKLTREGIRAIRRYPSEVRQRVPVVAQYPKLVGELLDALNDPAPNAVTLALAKYPKDVQEAGAKLAQTPEVLEVMLTMPDVTKAVGEYYAKHGLEALRAVVEEYLKETPETQASVTAWARRLGGNRAALEELVAAVAAFLQEKEGTEYQDYGLGVKVTPAKVAIYDLPPGPLTMFVLLHADQFPELADEMFEQWLRSASADDFDHAVAMWWQVVRQYFKPEVLDPKDRPARLTELAVLGKKITAEQKRQLPTPVERAKFLADHKAALPLAARFLIDPDKLPPPLKEGEAVPKPKVAAKPKPEFAPLPQTPRKPTPTVASKSLASAQRPPVPETVTQEKATAEQETRRAAHYNYYWWTYQSAPSVPYYSAYDARYARLPYNTPYFTPYYRGGTVSPRGGGGLNRPLGGGGRGR